MARSAAPLIDITRPPAEFEKDRWLVGQGADTLGGATYVVHLDKPYFCCQYAPVGDAPADLCVIHSEDEWVFFDPLWFAGTQPTHQDIRALMHEAARAIARQPV